MKTDLLSGKFFNRSPATLRKMNEALAFRHLHLNNVIKSIPNEKKHLDILYESIFDQAFLDFRIEEPTNPGYRVAISVNYKHLPSVVLSNIQKRIRFYIKDLIANKVNNQDLIITPSPAVYFASDSQIITELGLLLKKNEANFQVNRGKELSTDELYYKVLMGGYKDNKRELNNAIFKVSKALSGDVEIFKVGNS